MSLERFLSAFERGVAALEALAGTAAKDVAAVVGTAEAAVKRPRGRPPASAAAPATPPTPAQTSAAPAAATAPAAAEPEVPKVPTLQQVADAIIDLANNFSREAAVAILTAQGVKKVPELKPEQFQSVLDAVAKAKAPAASSGLV